MKTEHLCPCCSNKPFNDCCGKYLNGKALPKIPVALMRSRYTAYSLGDINYIEATVSGEAKQLFNKLNAKLWSEKATFHRLDVLNHSTSVDTGVVEYIAYYQENGAEHQLHEISQFERINNKWYYVSGSYPEE